MLALGLAFAWLDNDWGAAVFMTVLVIATRLEPLPLAKIWLESRRANLGPRPTPAETLDVAFLASVAVVKTRGNYAAVRR
jgi:hypothetical protein